MCLAQSNACSWGLPGCQAPNRWDHSWCWVSLLGTICTLFSQHPISGCHKSNFRDEECAKAGEIAIFCFGSTHKNTGILSHWTAGFCANGNDPPEQNENPISVNKQGVLVWRKVRTTAACNKLYIPMNGCVVWGGALPALTCTIHPRVAQHHPSSLNWGSCLAAVPTHSRCRWSTGRWLHQWFIFQWIMCLWLVSLDYWSLLKECATWQSETEHKL